MPDPQTASPDTSKMSPAALALYLQGLFQPAQTGATGLLNQLAGSGPGGIYDPTQDLAAAAQKSQLAGTLPTSADTEAQAAAQQARGADYLTQQLSGVPIPQEGMLPQPNFPQLELPGQPDTARPQVSPLAQLLTIGAGFASPRSAGQFNASALEGAIRGAQEENERRQQRDKADIARRSLLYDASMSAAKERQRIDESNRDAAFRNTVATTDRQMLLAKAKTEQFTAHGAADSLKAFAEKYDPALKARDEVKALLDSIDLKGKASSERVKSVSELLTAVHKEDTAGAGMTKDVFNQIMEGTRAAATSRATDARQAAHDQRTAAAAMARERETQRAETGRESMREANARRLEQMRANSEISKLDHEEKIQQRKIAAMHKGVASIKQSQENQKRLQTDLQKAEEAVSTAQANLDAANTGVTVGGLTGAPARKAYEAQVNSWRRRADDLAKALRTEQMRESTLGGGATGTFDPNTGEVIDE